MYTANTVNQEKSRAALLSVPFRKLIAPIVVLLVGIGSSYTLMRLVNYKVESDRQFEFDKSASSIMSRVQTGFATQEQVLSNLDGLFKANVQVVRDVFELYSTIPAKAEPGILCIAYANSVYSNQLNDLILYNRSERYYDYHVFPSGQREHYEPISYVIPYESNTHISGFDLLSNPFFADAINRARTDKKVAVSPVFNYRGIDTASIVLMKIVEKKQSADTVAAPADLLALGSSSDKFDGVIFIELNANKFFRSIIGDTVGSDKNIIYSCRTSDLNSKQQTVYSSANFSAAAQLPEIISSDRVFTVGDRKFVMHIANSPGFAGGFQSYLGIVALLSGLLISFAITAFLLSVVSSQQRAVNLADRITKSNRRILELSGDIIGTISMGGMWASVNPAIKNILGYNVQDLIGKHISQHFADASEYAHFAFLISQTSDETDIHFDVLMKAVSGDDRWISWNCTVAVNEGLVYCNGHDITDAKRAEAEIKLKSKQVAVAEQLAHEANEYKSSFMIRLTNNLRGSLSETLLNLHRISSQMDYSDDNQLQFLKLANQSSDQLYNIVSDLFDVAKETSVSAVGNNSITLLRCINDAHSAVRSNPEIATDIELHSTGVKSDLVVPMDGNFLTSALSNLFGAMSGSASLSRIQILVQENTVENVLELQLISQADEMVSRMIKRYNITASNIIDELRNDEGNVMFRLSVAASQLRRVNCTMSVETLGVEGNVVFITLPTFVTEEVKTMRSGVAIM